MARQYAACRGTDVGAIEVGANAFGQLDYVVFAEAGVRARGAGLRGLDQDFDAPNEHLPIDTAEIPRVAVQHGTRGTRSFVHVNCHLLRGGFSGAYPPAPPLYNLAPAN